MRHFPICCALLLAGCTGSDGPQVVTPPPSVPADLLRPAAGYAGPVPRTEGQLSDALIAEVRGRQRAKAQLGAISDILIQEKDDAD